MAKAESKDVSVVFGFDELEKSFSKIQKRYPDAADAVLMSAGQRVNRRVKTLTPVHKGAYRGLKAGKRKPGNLRRSWRLKKPKTYKNGKVRVVREQTADPVGHLIEDGHEVVRGGSIYTRGELGRRRLTNREMEKKKVSRTGYAPAYRMLEKAVREAQEYLVKNAEKMLDKLTKDLEV